MKLVTKSSEKTHLEYLKQRLQENGIPAFIGGENTARVIPFWYMTQAGLWVYDDSQLMDAHELILNEHHVVNNKIDVEKFYAEQPDAANQSLHMNHALSHLALMVLGAIIVLFVFSWLLGNP